MVSVRPEKIQVSLSPPAEAANCFEGRLLNLMYLGTHVHCTIELRSGDRVTVLQPNTSNFLPSADTPIFLSWQVQDCLALPVE
jgi:spermidine/putrescine transport system ATP-binding protein